MKYKILISFLFLLCICNSIGFTQVAIKPNIIFIVIDDLNDYIEELGGSVDVETPNINRISANGTLFNNAEC